jgi:2-succinyl-5-enolpyruvyl-6-hydroxy-3-cyclohexene-1-carboxylate synthase
MPDSRNVNTLWASVLVETLLQLGLETVVVCPGSRSAPLAVACAEQSDLEAIPILDERSAAFFALGLARQRHKPVAVVCTSGTAGANFFPAVIEAAESGIPLLLLTADRPPELRQCHAGQAIDQHRLFGHYPRWHVELALPALDIDRLRYLRQTVAHAWLRSLGPMPGPVHLNCPFREPLTPISDPESITFAATLDWSIFYAHLQGPTERPFPWPTLLPAWTAEPRGVIVVGPAQPPDPDLFTRAIALLSMHLGWPVLADTLNPLRHRASQLPTLVPTYDLLLRHPGVATHLRPKQVLQIGELPTSKTLREWLTAAEAQHWVISPSEHNLDPLHGQTRVICCDPEAWAIALKDLPPPLAASDYCQEWCMVDQVTQAYLNVAIAAIDKVSEPALAWHLSEWLPPDQPIFVANSTPIRDVEWFWQRNNKHFSVYCNRGANGIDGTLSTALGIAHRNRPSLLISGDLALLHDTNGFLLQPQLHCSLTILLINNQGGGIFGLLPIRHFDPPFEPFFTTPQQIDFQSLARAYSLPYQRIEQWDQLQQALSEWPQQGVRLLELRTDRKEDARWRQACFTQALTVIDGLWPEAADPPERWTAK